MEPLANLLASRGAEASTSWEYRFILLLWLSHLLLTPFDLSTISSQSSESVSLPQQLDIKELPDLSRRLLQLGLAHLSSTGNRESDAASLLIVRLCLRKDMQSLGLLSAMVSWCLDTFSLSQQSPGSPHATLFLKTAILSVLAGFLAQADLVAITPFITPILKLVQSLESADGEEWKSANVRRLGMKIYRWAAALSLSSEGEGGKEEVVEDIIERLLSSLGDRDTAVRLGASKSLAVISRKLSPDLAGEVLEAVMAIYDEDVFYSPADGPDRKKMLTAVDSEKWHGATLTLATFLRQRAVRDAVVLERVVRCIVSSLSFEQRRATFALGGNVRDAACYAAWSLSRSYTTDELRDVGDFEGRGSVLQVLATELAVAGSLDPLGNIRRAASAALQELVGRHPWMVEEGIRIVQIVDYSAVALRRRSVVKVAAELAGLASGYWLAVVNGIVEGWRGIGSSDVDGRKLAGDGLGELIYLSFPKDTGSPEEKDARAKHVITSLLHRIRTDGGSDIEIYHGATWALSSALLSVPTSSLASMTPTLLIDPFDKLTGSEFLNPLLRPELTSESTSRLVYSLCSFNPCSLSVLRLYTAIIDASLDRNEDLVLQQAVPAAKRLLSILSSSDKERLAGSWNRRASSKKRGYILVLGEILCFFPEQAGLRTTTISTLLREASKPGQAEGRASAIRALSVGVLSQGNVSEDVVEALLKALDDYEVDLRGDVGSWVRVEAIKAVADNWDKLGHRDVERQVAERIVRLCGERLDRVRVRACEALLKIAGGGGWEELEGYIDRYLAPLTTYNFPCLFLTRFYSEVLATEASSSNVTSLQYFTALIPLLNHPSLSTPLLQGLVTSAGAGSDTLLKTSRAALIAYLSSAAPPFTSSILTTLANLLQSDRTTTPALEVISAILESIPCTPLPANLLPAVQRSHYKTSSPSRLAAAIRVYAGIYMNEGGAGRKAVMRRLLAILGHPFPKIREAAAETIVAVVGCLGEDDGGLVDVVVGWDWMGGGKEGRAVVQRLKGMVE